MPVTRKDTSVFLVGNYYPQIVGSKLPSNRDVLKVLFFNIREVQLDVHENAKLVIREILTFWNKARIPTKYECGCVKNLETLYESWRKVQRNSNRKSNTVKEVAFVNELNNLFDVAHKNALNTIKTEEDKLFLEAQRRPGRDGFMYGIDWEQVKKEERADARMKQRLEDYGVRQLRVIRFH